MQVRKMSRSMLFAFALCSYAGMSMAADPATSTYLLTLTNSTTETQALHYRVKPSGQAAIDGNLPAGDHRGATIAIENGDKGSEIIVTDAAGHLIWNGKVTYYATGTEFYTTTVALSPQYQVGTNAFTNIHTIAFDISNA